MIGQFDPRRFLRRTERGLRLSTIGCYIWAPPPLPDYSGMPTS
jgi:hypothetical protein